MSETSSVSSDASSRVSIKDFRVDSRELAYMAKLKKTLMEKRGVVETTATMTVAHLRAINGGNGFTSLSFLSDVETVRAAIEKDHTTGTQKQYYSAIISALSTTDSSRYKKPLETYRNLFNGKKDEVKKETEARGTALTEKEAAVWMDWPDILRHYERVGREVKAILKKPGFMTSVDYDRVQDHMILALYTQMPPRRNKDYGQMFVTRKEPGTDLTKNYYVMEQGKMYFNVYKTAKTHGAQVVDVPEDVQAIILRYLKLTGSYRSSRGRAPMMPLICSYDGAHLYQQNRMTLLLHRAFGKKIGCNIIRHAYISNLYTPAVLTMGETALAMGHGRSTHLSYFRTPAGGAGTTDMSSEASSVIEHM